jgi:hypothetical protein
MKQKRGKDRFQAILAATLTVYRWPLSDSRLATRSGQSASTPADIRGLTR